MVIKDRHKREKKDDEAIYIYINGGEGREKYCESGVKLNLGGGHWARAEAPAMKAEEDEGKRGAVGMRMNQ